MTERKLPTGWARTALGELGQWFGGGTPSKRNPEFWESGTIPWLSPKDMGASLLVDTRDRITEAAVAGSATSLVPANSVALVVRSGILERKVPISLVPFETTLNQDMKAVVPHTGVDPKWLLYILQSQEHAILHGCRKSGTTVASLDTAKLYGLPILLPPLTEQHRMVEVLEDYFSRLDAADSGVRSAVARTSNLISSSHKSALSGTDNGDSVRIGDIAKVGSGATPLRGNAQYYNGGTIPWATSGDLHAGDIFDVPGRITEAALRETAVKLWPAGTLLVAMYGEGRTRGTVAELHIASTTNQACAAIVLHPEFTSLKRWVRFILRTRYDEMRSQASGGVQPNLSLGRIKEIPIPMPDVEIRNAILAEDEANSEAVDRLRLAGEQSLARSTALRRSLLRAAFSGELVDQDPTDEPAAVTLARIRAQQPGIKPRPRRKVVVAK